MKPEICNSQIHHEKNHLIAMACQIICKTIRASKITCNKTNSRDRITTNIQIKSRILIKTKITIMKCFTTKNNKGMVDKAGMNKMINNMMNMTFKNLKIQMANKIIGTSKRNKDRLSTNSNIMINMSTIHKTKENNMSLHQTKCLIKNKVINLKY
jgi:hypothetical protein